MSHLESLQLPYHPLVSLSLPSLPVLHIQLATSLLGGSQEEQV